MGGFTGFRVVAALIWVLGAAALGSCGDTEGQARKSIEQVCPGLNAGPITRLSGTHPPLVRAASFAEGRTRVCRGAYPADSPPADGAVIEVGQPAPSIPGGGITAFEVLRQSNDSSHILENAGFGCQRGPVIDERPTYQLYVCPVRTEDGMAVLGATAVCLLDDVTWTWEARLAPDRVPADVPAAAKEWFPGRC